MFIITQFIGLYVINFYLSEQEKIPYGFDQTENIEKDSELYLQFFISLIISFLLAIAIVFLLMKVRYILFMRAWFFIVIALSLGITLNVITSKINLIYPSLFSIVFGVTLAYFKVFKRDLVIHNLTELLIYPGIATIFVSILNLPFTILLLIAISIYDIWAVWHSKVMQKMAKFQINSLGIFGGFFLPYASKEIKQKIKNLKLKYKDKIPLSVIKRSKIKVNLAILGGGDVIFPAISAGVMLKTFNSFMPAFSVIFFASLSLLYLFIFAKKRKFYPAMPYLTAGIFIGMLVGWLIL